MDDTTMTEAPDGANAAIDMDADYESEMAIDAPPDAVFDALTTLPGLAGWWTTVSGSGVAGGRLTFVFNDMPVVMQVTTTERPSTVRWTCLESRPTPDWVGTTVSFDVLSGQDGGSVVRFRHHGLTPRLECYSDCRNGWDHFLPSLCAYAASGHGHPWGSSADVERREDRRVRNDARLDPALVQR